LIEAVVHKFSEWKAIEDKTGKSYLEIKKEKNTFGFRQK
jgi:hypothetical protein